MGNEAAGPFWTIIPPPPFSFSLACPPIKLRGGAVYLRSGRSFVPNGVRSEAPTDVGLCRCIRRVPRAPERGAKSVCMYPPVGALKDSDPPFFPPVCTPCSAHLHKNLLSEGGGGQPGWGSSDPFHT